MTRDRHSRRTLGVDYFNQGRPFAAIRQRVIKRSQRVAVVAVLLLVAWGCGDERTQSSLEDDWEPLYFEILAQGAAAAVDDTLEVVAKDKETWRSYQQELALRRQPPAVDFEQMMVLLAAVPAPTGGYTVEFRSVELAGDSVVARYALGVPGEDCITTMGQTVPFQAIAVRRANVPVVFERTREEIRCTFR